MGTVVDEPPLLGVDTYAPLCSRARARTHPREGTLKHNATTTSTRRGRSRSRSPARTRSKSPGPAGRVPSGSEAESTLAFRPVRQVGHWHPHKRKRSRTQRSALSQCRDGPAAAAQLEYGPNRQAPAPGGSRARCVFAQARARAGVRVLQRRVGSCARGVGASAMR